MSSWSVDPYVILKCSLHHTSIRFSIIIDMFGFRFIILTILFYFSFVVFVLVSSSFPFFGYLWYFFLSRGITLLCIFDCHEEYIIHLWFFTFHLEYYYSANFFWIYITILPYGWKRNNIDSSGKQFPILSVCVENVLPTKLLMKLQKSY